MKKSFLAVVLVGLVVFAWQGVASAHANVVSGVVACQSNGTQAITWKIENDFNASESASFSDGGSFSGTATIAASPGSPFTFVTAVETLPGSQTGTVTLTVHGTWSDAQTHTDSATVTLLGTCGTPPTHATVCRLVGNVWQTVNLTIPPDQVQPNDHTGNCPDPLVVCRNGSTISVMPWEVISGDRSGTCVSQSSLLVCRNGVTRLLLIPPDVLFATDGIGGCLPPTVQAPAPPVQVEAATAVRGNASFTG
jgi:hypothetical protein